MRRTALISLCVIALAFVAFAAIANKDWKNLAYYAVTQFGSSLLRLPEIIWEIGGIVCGALSILLLVRAINRYAKRRLPRNDPP